MQPLTDEERKKLCAELRNPYERDFATFARAADEIERLSKSATFWQQEAGKWADAFSKARQRYEGAKKGVEIWSR